MQFNEERLRELAEQNSKALGDITQAEERHLTAEQELTELTGRLEASQAALDQHRNALQGKQQAVQAVEAELRRLQEAQRQAQSEAFAQAQHLTRARNEINALDLQKQGNVVRLEKLSAEKIQLEEERGQLGTRLSEFAANVEAQKLSAQTQRGTVEERQARLREIQQELTGLTQELDAQLQKQAEKRSRLNVLEQLQSDHEGFSAGTLAALKNAEQVLGSLADRIRVPDQYITAVETALGHHLQLVITETPEAAQRILADLSANKKGRASIAPLSLGSATGAAGDLPATSHPTALSVVEGEASIQPLLQSLLSRTLIVPDLATATNAWRESNGAFDFVTLSGEMLSRHGVYTGGSANGSGKAPGSILGRKNQIVELQTVLGQAQEQVTQLSRRKGALLSEQTSLQAGLQQAQTELRQQEVAIATHQGEFNALQNSQRLLHQKIDTVVYEIQSLAAQEQEGSQKRTTLAQQIGELETREQALAQQAAEITSSLEGLRQQRDQTTAALTETKVSLASEEQICASFRHQQQSLQQRLRELAQLVEQRRSEVSSFLNRKTQAEGEIQESRRQIESLQLDREQVNNQAAGLLGQKSEQESDIETRENDLREQRRRLSECQQQRGGLEVELAQKNMSVQNLRERIQQKFHLNLDDIRSECITITYADEGPAKVQTLTPEEMSTSGVATDWKAVGEQVATLQQRIDEMGPVNLVAIEEYEETEQRHTFLTAQHDDLVKRFQGAVARSDQPHQSIDPSDVHGNV